ncbi:MAG: FtsW/RodA/SpoVE family cell cycle protein [Planctomycetia bacterium]|nr:MAG: FtsW/RodA/SpoVE family cell cycle protein [Planctomycetia bacterium]
MPRTAAQPDPRPALQVNDAAGAGMLYDGTVVFLVGLLMTLGVVIVFSASVGVGPLNLSIETLLHSPLRHAAFALTAFIGMLIVAHMDYRALACTTPRRAFVVLTIFGVAVMLQAAALIIPDRAAGGIGGQRSVPIPIGGGALSFQPAEFGKVALVLALAGLLTCRWFSIRSFLRGFLPVVLCCGLLIGLTGLADFGTAALLGVMTLILLILGGARWLHLAAMALAGAGAGAILILAAPYRIERIRTFLSGAADEAGSGYQIRQSLIAIGSGGWWGRGLGASVQSYGYLPQANNDFVFAVICEELGVIGGIGVIGVFLLLLFRGLFLARQAPDAFGRLLATGLAVMIGLQAAFNVGVVTHALPTKGISLPFVSEGGSGIVFLGLGAGLLAAVGRGAARRSA